MCPSFRQNIDQINRYVCLQRDKIWKSLKGVNTSTRHTQLPACCSYSVKDHFVRFLTSKSNREYPETNRDTQIHKSCRWVRQISRKRLPDFLFLFFQKAVLLNTLTSRVPISYQFTLSKLSKQTDSQSHNGMDLNIYF